jgi:hypothetical protein
MKFQWNPYKLVKELIAQYKHKKRLEKKLEELRKKDPYIYD